MSIQLHTTMLLPTHTTRSLLIKWIVGLLVPVAVFTFVWSGERIVNDVLLGLITPASARYDTSTLLQAAIFIAIFYAAILALTGYLVAADSGRGGTITLWTNILIFAVVPLLLVISLNDLIIGLAACPVIWLAYFYARRFIRKARHHPASSVIDTLKVLPAEEQAILLSRATAGGFWFGTTFALISLVTDLVYYFIGALPTILLLWVAIRTLILPIAGYFLGRLGGTIALRRTLAAQNNGNTNGENSNRISKRRQLQVLSSTRAREEAKDLVPNDLPLLSTGAQRFYLLLLLAFVLFYPVLDPFLFGFGTAGRLANFGDAGRYVILALGLNIVVGFAGLLDLGYVAFFAIGAYTWGLVGSQQLHFLTGIIVNPQTWPWLFWPMVLGSALVAAFFGVILGVPTLRLRGDYLAIVTLGFGEIVPVIFLNLDKYTHGTNGLTGVYSPAFPGIEWNVSTPVPYYYLILALIAFVLFANVRLRDSRLGRAWIAIREDEIAAASSGVNLVRTKLFAFGAGAFFSGIAGVYYVAKLGTVSPENFSFSDSVIFLAMVVIGGLGSIPGVIVGALAVYAINVLILSQLDIVAGDPHSLLNPLYTGIIQVLPNFSFNNIRNMIFGIILIVIMVYRPEGLIPSARRRRELRSATNETAAVDALDVVPGAPGFEEEVRVE